jgi:Spy/CpxP family protein refolding chaperone
MKKGIFVRLTVIAVMMVMAVGTPSFAIESTVVMKTSDENLGPNRQAYGPGADDEGERGGGRGRFRAQLKRFFLHDLGLTQEQRAKLRELRTESRQRMQEARTAVRKIREEKLNMLLSGKVDKDRLAKLDKQFMKYHVRIDEERLRLQRERAAILTPDQAKRLGEFMKSKRDEFKARQSSRRERRRGFDRN